jgi:hypothetical protein
LRSQRETLSSIQGRHFFTGAIHDRHHSHRFHRPGKTGEAVAFGHQVAKYFKDKYATPLEVLLPIGGNPARIAW